jgi:hypothetical protein
MYEGIETLGRAVAHPGLSFQPLKSEARRTAAVDSAMSDLERPEMSPTVASTRARRRTRRGR